MLGVLYEHPEWFVPLFAELDRRGVPYGRILADRLEFDPGHTESEYTLVFNRMSPSAYLRGHARAIFATQHYLAYLERLDVPTINGLAAYALELSKARQLQLLAQLALPAPKTRVANSAEQLTRAAAGSLAFPVIVKPNVGGSGARMRRFDAAAELRRACENGELEGLFEIDGTALVQEYHPPIGGSIVRVEVLDGEFLYAIRIYNDPNDGFNLCPADICQVPQEEMDSRPADLPPHGQPDFRQADIAPRGDVDFRPGDVTPQPQRDFRHGKVPQQVGMDSRRGDVPPPGQRDFRQREVPPQEALDFCPADVSAKPGRRIEAFLPPRWVIDSVLRIAKAGNLDLGGVEYLESDRDGQLYFYDINSLSNFVTDATNLVGFDPFERLGALVERRWRESYAREPGHGAKALSGLATPRRLG